MMYYLFRDPMMAAIKQTADKYPNYKIMFIGASLGAAIVELNAVDFVYNFGDLGYINRVEAITFGTPRTGSKIWANFVDSMNFKKIRLVAYGDPVSHLPPKVDYQLILVSRISTFSYRIHAFPKRHDRQVSGT